MTHYDVIECGTPSFDSFLDANESWQHVMSISPAETSMHQAYTCSRITSVDALVSPNGHDSVESLYYCSHEKAQEYQLPPWITYEWSIKKMSPKLLQTIRDHSSSTSFPVVMGDIVQNRPIRVVSYVTLMKEYYIRSVGSLIVDEFHTPILIDAAANYWSQHPHAAPIVLHIRSSETNTIDHVDHVMDKLNRLIPNERFHYRLADAGNGGQGAKGSSHYDQHTTYKFRRDVTVYLCTDMRFSCGRTYSCLTKVLCSYGIEVHRFHLGRTKGSDETLMEGLRVEPHSILLCNSTSVCRELPWKTNLSESDFVSLARRMLLHIHFSRIGEYGALESVHPDFTKHVTYTGVAQTTCRELEAKLQGTRNVPWTPYGVGDEFIRLVRLMTVAYRGFQRASDNRYVITIGVRKEEYMVDWIREIQSMLNARMYARGFTFLIVTPNRTLPASTTQTPSLVDVVDSLRPIDIWVSLSKSDGGPSSAFECAAMGIPIIVKHGSGNASTLEGVLTHTSNYHLSGIIESLVTDNEYFIRYAKQMKQQVCDQWSTEKLLRENMLPVIMNLLSTC